MAAKRKTSPYGEYGSPEWLRWYRGANRIQSRSAGTEHDEKYLSILQRSHSAGSPSAARRALDYCALNRVVIPDWLALVVHRAIEVSRRGVSDDLLGFGNEKMLARWRREFVQGRDNAIRQSIDNGYAWHRKQGYKTTKAELVQATTDLHNISTKDVERIIYGRKSPTAKPKK